MMPLLRSAAAGGCLVCRRHRPSPLPPSRCHGLTELEGPRVTRGRREEAEAAAEASLDALQKMQGTMVAVVEAAEKVAAAEK